MLQNNEMQLKAPFNANLDRKVHPLLIIAMVVDRGCRTRLALCDLSLPCAQDSSPSSLSLLPSKLHLLSCTAFYYSDVWLFNDTYPGISREPEVRMDEIAFWSFLVHNSLQALCPRKLSNHCIVQPCNNLIDRLELTIRKCSSEPSFLMHPVFYRGSRNGA
jgi:hypothetical protein